MLIRVQATFIESFFGHYNLPSLKWNNIVQGNVKQGL